MCLLSVGWRENCVWYERVVIEGEGDKFVWNIKNIEWWIVGKIKVGRGVVVSEKCLYLVGEKFGKWMVVELV